MLIASLIVETDEKSENVLMVTAICRQIILVSTSTVQAPAMNSANMKMPAQTAPVVELGSQQASQSNVNVNALVGLQ